MPTTLIVDDDPALRDALTELVEDEGFEARDVGTLAEARQHLESAAPDLVLVDLKLPDGSGMELLGALEESPDTEVVLVTGHASVDSAVEALRTGATDYLTKPVDVARLRSILMNVARRRELSQEIAGLRAELRELGRFGALIGASTPMQQVYDLIARVAPRDASVLVQGASGTGKELVAETIHRLSRRRKSPMLTLNCGAVSPQLIESELFGHERGSFTGADRTHRGYFERASGGTLFLDEITEMPIELQVKLLRVLETGRFTRIGGEREQAVDVRVIAATNREPQQAVAGGAFREDLYYRLNVFPIRLPPLRERSGDVELLAEAFLAELNRGEGTQKRFTRATLERLRLEAWPGNVRQLKNAVQRAFILAEDSITPACLPDTPATDTTAAAGVPNGTTVQVPIGSSIADVERSLILATLDANDGDKEASAKILGISLKTLYNRLNAYKGG